MRRLHPDRSTNIPTHMRHFQRICVANSPSTPFNPLPVQYSHAYAYNPTHMRGTHIQNSISYYPPTPRHPCLRLGVLLPLTTAPTTSLTPYHPCICVQTYAYAWDLRTSITLCCPHRASPRIDHFYASSLRVLGDKRPFEEKLKQRRGRKAQASH
ncbi:hypothetical protein PIB30_101499, partial [Stylosanthes scabra]|nr:hypothetical protein [Stylosanthes scabra]